MSDLAEALRQLADYHVKSPAYVVRTPDSGYVVSPGGAGWGAPSRCVISRSQLGTLMWESGLRREELADPQTAAQLAAVVVSREVGSPRQIVQYVSSHFGSGDRATVRDLQRPDAAEDRSCVGPAPSGRRALIDNGGLDGVELRAVRWALLECRGEAHRPGTATDTDGRHEAPSRHRRRYDCRLCAVTRCGSRSTAAA